jgi:hypothetical protein
LIGRTADTWLHANTRSTGANAGSHADPGSTDTDAGSHADTGSTNAYAGSHADARSTGVDAAASRAHLGHRVADQNVSCELQRHECADGQSDIANASRRNTGQHEPPTAKPNALRRLSCCQTPFAGPAFAARVRGSVN